MATEIRDKEKVTKFLKEKPIVVFFYMDGCPHCENTMGPWKELCAKRSDYKFAQVESANVPDGMNIQGFPHFEARHDDGEEDEADGAKESAEDIESSLKLRPKRGGSRRRRARRFTRRIRKRTYRTRRRHIPF